MEEKRDYDGAPVYQDESQTEASDMETKERENTNKIPRRDNSGKGVDQLEMKSKGKKYYTQFTRTGEKRK